MKKLVSALSLIGCLVLSTPNTSNAQAVEQGNVIFAVQYGFPNLFNMVIKSAYDNGGYTGLKISGFGPIGMHFEYMVADKIGLGIKTNYSTTKISYVEDALVMDANGNLVSSPYDYELKISRLRAMARFALHFGNSDKFDGYFGVNAGLSTLKVSYTSNDPNYTGDVAFSNPVPVGFRLDVGGNYFFTDNFGLNMEIGLGGGPIVNAGIALKF